MSPDEHLADIGGGAVNRALRVRAIQEALAGRHGRAELFLDAASTSRPWRPARAVGA